MEIKINKWLLLWIFLGVIILLFSCIDQINLTLEDDQEFLVVDGSFSTDIGPHVIELYYATGQRVQAKRQVTGAEIKLLENDQLKGVFSEIAEGIYQIEDLGIIGAVGESYHIEIRVTTGEIYRSSPEIMPRKIRGDSVFFDFTLFEEQTSVGIIGKPSIEAFIATPLPQNTAPFWLKWETQTMYSFPEVICSPLAPPPVICYILGNESEQQINLLNGTDVVSNYLPKWKVFEKLIPPVDQEYRGRHYFLVNQQSITKNTFDYWTKVNRIANQTGSIFDAPPAAVPGNISNIENPTEVVLGYFELTNTDSLRGFVTKGDFFEFYKFTSNTCSDILNPTATNARACCNCHIIDRERNTTVRPSWW